MENADADDIVADDIVEGAHFLLERPSLVNERQEEEEDHVDDELDESKKADTGSKTEEAEKRQELTPQHDDDDDDEQDLILTLSHSFTHYLPLDTCRNGLSLAPTELKRLLVFAPRLSSFNHFVDNPGSLLHPLTTQLLWEKHLNAETKGGGNSGSSVGAPGVDTAGGVSFASPGNPSSGGKPQGTTSGSTRTNNAAASSTKAVGGQNGGRFLKNFHENDPLQDPKEIRRTLFQNGHPGMFFDRVLSGDDIDMAIEKWRIASEIHELLLKSTPEVSQQKQKMMKDVSFQQIVQRFWWKLVSAGAFSSSASAPPGSYNSMSSGSFLTNNSQAVDSSSFTFMQQQQRRQRRVSDASGGGGMSSMMRSNSSSQEFFVQQRHRDDPQSPILPLRGEGKGGKWGEEDGSGPAGSSSFSLKSQQQPSQPSPLSLKSNSFFQRRRHTTAAAAASANNSSSFLIPQLIFYYFELRCYVVLFDDACLLEAIDSMEGDYFWAATWKNTSENAEEEEEAIEKNKMVGMDREGGGMKKMNEAEEIHVGISSFQPPAQPTTTTQQVSFDNHHMEDASEGKKKHGNNNGVSLEAFEEWMFQFADNWTSSIKLEEYVAFLNDLLIKVFAPEWAADADTLFEIQMKKKIPDAVAVKNFQQWNEAKSMQKARLKLKFVSSLKNGKDEDKEDGREELEKEKRRQKRREEKKQEKIRKRMLEKEEKRKTAVGQKLDAYSTEQIIITVSSSESEVSSDIDDDDDDDETDSVPSAKIINKETMTKRQIAQYMRQERFKRQLANVKTYQAIPNKLMALTAKLTLPDALQDVVSRYNNNNSNRRPTASDTVMGGHNKKMSLCGKKPGQSPKKKTAKRPFSMTGSEVGIGGLLQRKQQQGTGMKGGQRGSSALRRK